jgi:perosamine synthetase
MYEVHNDLIGFIKQHYHLKDGIPLHAPVFQGNEKKYLIDCIESTFVSYIGKYVTQFEEMTAQFTGAKYAVAVVNGTVALQIALQVAGVKRGDEVITQALTFAATANAIAHTGASPVFIDVDKDTMGMSPVALRLWMEANVELRGDKEFGKADGSVVAYNKLTNNKLSAIVPMHTFGHPCRIDEIKKIADEYSILVIEDAAESLGSYYNGQHTGTFGKAGVLSYNGNKTITTGGGGMIITDDENFAKHAKHITTTAKVPHPWEYYHDEVGYNFRLTNVSAAIGVAQMEKIDYYLADKRNTASQYEIFCSVRSIDLVKEPPNSKSNYWLNAVILGDRLEREAFLENSNKQGVMTRPIWRLMNKLEMYEHSQHDDLTNSQWLEDRVVNIPSGVNL